MIATNLLVYAIFGASVEHPDIDFATVLASAVHDMKNSLCMLIQSIDLLQQQLAPTAQTASQELGRIHYEASRLNTNLLQLLSLYRIEKDQLPIHMDEYYLDELCEEIVIRNQLYSEQRCISVSIQCESNLCWFFDNDLISNLINDMFVNALRYSKSKLLLRAYQQDNQLRIELHDDGDGYPAEMLESNAESLGALSLAAGRTGLGLFFAHLIANAHRNQQRRGFIELSNGGEYGGAVFRLTLP